MEVYEPGGVCPKCGHDAFTVCWHEAFRYRRPLDGPKAEHLSVVCETMRFSRARCGSCAIGTPRTARGTIRPIVPAWMPRPPRTGTSGQRSVIL